MLDRSKGPNARRLELPFLLTLALGWVVIYADRISISPLLLIIEHEFHLNNLQVSLIVSIYFLAYVGFTIPITIIAAKYGFKQVMIAFFLLAAVSILVAGVIGYTYALLVLLIGLHGTGAGGYYPTAYTISSTLVPKQKVGFGTGLINSGMGFGTILGLVIAGPILSIFPNNWQIILIILSFPTFVVLVLLYKFVPKLQSKPISSSEILGHYASVLKHKSFLLICATQFCSLYGYWVILTWAPSFLQTRGQSVLSSGATTAVFAAVAIVPSVIISRHTDRIGRKKVPIVILPLAAASIFFMAYNSNLYEFLVAIVIYGIVGKLTLDPIVLAWNSDIIPAELLGASLAILNVTGMSSSILAPVITGALGDATGSLADGFYFGAFIVILGTVFVAFAGRTK